MSTSMTTTPTVRPPRTCPRCPTTWGVAITLTALALLLGSVSARGFDEPAAQPAPSLDDELLKDLESDLEGGLGEDEAKTPPQRPRGETAPMGGKRPLGGAAPGKKPADASEPRVDEDELDRELLRQLQPDAGEEDHALSRIGRSMREVGELVGQAKSGQPTQQKQEQIVADLDKLLEAARQRQRQSKSSSSQQQTASRQPAGQQSQPGKSGNGGNQPAQESSENLRDRTAATPDPAEMKDLLRDLWGHLPEHERQMVINSTIERFLPKYELLIEAYFKRLAEETADR
ncbi:MAG: hypothetical protein JNG90_16495 [Planctomycetaceae bacterium]|nr:hypothetical protein [Planctomycetaceae bacterium]